MVKKILFVLIPFVFISCAATLSFDVRHPPLVDLREIKTITIIPFEWSGSRIYNLEEKVTAVLRYDLINSVRNSGIEYVDPSVLKNIRERDYRNYVDVYITGRIAGVYFYDSNPSAEQRRRRYGERDGRRRNNDQYSRDPGRYNNDQYLRDMRRDRTQQATNTNYRTVIVEIEYSYIRASNNETLGQYKKTRSHHFEQRNSWDTWRDNRIYMTDNAAAEEAASRFTINSHELAPWTSTEERKVKGKTGAPELNEALKMIRHTYYGRAMGIYTDLYENTGDKLAGYNLAILLQFDSKYTDALALLEEIREREIRSGNRTPSYVIKEIETLKGFIKGFQILEGYGVKNTQISP
ncbi:MAG: hypothetical protein FWB73_08185 [Treponema sp.]|nr:hypothetical protein [Treponema sp.]